jgi:uncharacterized membrane protein YccC
MAIAVALVALVDPIPGPLVLAAVLAMTLSRNKLVTTWRGRIEAVILLPVVGLATAGVGYLFLAIPLVGAAGFVLAMFLSIWFRRFGATWSRIGSLIALPFTTLLIAPGAGVGTTPPGVALLSVVVLVVVVAVRLLAELTHLVPRAGELHPGALAQARTPKAEAKVESAAAQSAPTRATDPRLTVSDRMAIQMAIALAAGFVIGALVFPQHVTWVVLTAFIVCSGNRGRADVLYKSGLRVVGAAVGTVVASAALAFAPHGQTALQGPLLVVVLLGIIGVGLWLREWTYAAWAVMMTLVITLLQGVAIPVAAGTGGIQLWIRIIAIIVGAVCGILSSWFVLPVRSEDVVRKRISEALAALSDFAAARDPRTDHDLTASLERLDEIAPPWIALERVTTWRATTRKPGRWIDLVHETTRLVRASPRLSATARRALGDARKSMRDAASIGPALQAFRDELTDGVPG